MAYYKDLYNGDTLMATDYKLTIYIYTAAWITLSLAIDLHFPLQKFRTTCTRQLSTAASVRDESGPADNIHQKTMGVVNLNKQDSAKIC